MAKSKKSKILASMLAVSTMAVFYATPVMAMKYIDGSDYFVTNGTINTGTFIGGTYNGGTFNGELLFHGNANMENLLIDGVAVNAAAANGNYGDRLTVGGTTLDFAQANQTILNTEAIRRVVNKDAGMSATYLEETVKAHSAFGLQVLDKNGEVVATISRGGSGTFNGTVTTQDVNSNSNAHSVLSSGGLQLYNADGTSKVNITNTGASRFGAFNETSVRIENGQLQIRAANTAENADSSGLLLASLSEKGLTLVDDERNYFTLSATRLATINDVITEEGAVISKGDVTSKAADGTTYTLNTVGNNTSGIISGYDGQVTTIEGAFSVNENGYIYNANGSFKVSRDGAITASSYNGVTLATDGNKVLVGDIDVNDLKDKTQYMYHAETNTTGFKGAVNVEGNIRSTYGGFVIGDGSTALHKGELQLDGEVLASAKLGTINDVIDDNGNVKGTTVTTAAGADLDVVNGRTKHMTTIGSTTVFNNTVAINGEGLSIPGDNGATGIWLRKDGTIYAQNGMSTSGDFKTEAGYTLNTVGADLDTLEGNVGNIGENVGGITRTEGATDPGTGTTTIEDTLSVSKDSVSANVGNSFFNVEDDGIYMSNNGNGLAVGEDGISAYSGNASFNISNNNYNVTVGNSTMVVNGNGATFTNGEENGSTVINGGVVTSTGDFITLDEEGKQKYTLNTIGADLDTLEGNVGNIGENVGGINRIDANNDGKKETTIIEETLSVSEDQIGAVIGDSAFVLNDNYVGLYADSKTSITVASDGINLNGTVRFAGRDGHTYTLAGLEGRVTDLEKKTQWIEADENGTTITSPDGSTSVTVDNDGVKVNGDVTGEGGNVDVDGDVDVDGGVTVGEDENHQTVIEDDKVTTGTIDANEGKFNDSVTVGNGSDITTIDGSNITVGVGDNATIITDDTVKAENGHFGNITADTGTIGNATFDENGMTVGGFDGVSIKDDGITVGSEGGTVISDSDVVINSGTENEVSLSDVGNRVDNLEQGVAELNNRVGELEDRIDKVGAMAAAIANLRTMGYDPAAPTEVAVGIGQYRDETGAALGLFHYPNRDFMLSLSVSTSGDEVMGGIGATWKFGRKSPEKVAEIKKAQAEADARRAEEAKLAKAEEMKQAAKEAKIKAQQERHAKLAAERAAQAEAAK